jgi:hypothetical protein
MQSMNQMTVQVAAFSYVSLNANLRLILLTGFSMFLFFKLEFLCSFLILRSSLHTV